MRDRKDLAADMAWQVVTPREGLPGPGDMMQLPDEDDAMTRPWIASGWPEDDEGLEFLDRPRWRDTVGGLAITALLVAALYGLWVMTP